MKPDLDILRWLGAVLLYGLGDWATTVIATRYPGLEEGMTVTRGLLGPNPSAVGLGTLKSVVLSLSYLSWVLLESNPYRFVIPAGVAVLGAYATINNALAIRSVR